MNLIDKSINIQISIYINLTAFKSKNFYNPKILKKKTKHACF